MGNCCNTNHYVHYYQQPMSNGYCSGNREVPVFHLPMRRPTIGNNELFNIQWHQTNPCSSQGPRYVDYWSGFNNGCGCNGGYEYTYPVFYHGGAGSVNGGGTATAWSRKGYANSSALGSVIATNGRHGSKNYNLGALGSYARSGGTKAWSILGGQLSYAKSGGNKSVDASGLINTFLGSLIGNIGKYFGN